MKKALLVLLAIIAFSVGSFAQTKYYKGEWTQSNSTYLFKAIVKLDFSDTKVKGMILWTIVTPAANTTTYYANKLNKSGIEIVEGNYDSKTKDLNFLGLSKIDPDTVIGTDIYSLKVSADGNVIYGKTDANGKGNGFFYAMAAPAAATEKEFNALKEKIK